MAFIISLVRKGAHVCGFAGKIAQKELVKFERISGLDPARKFYFDKS